MNRAASFWAVVLVVVGTLSAAGAGQGAGGSLTAADYIEIEQLYARYARALDLGDPEAWADTFTADGVFRDAAGRDELVAYAENSYGRRQGTVRHWNSQLVVTPTAEGADGSAYLLLLDVGAQPPGINVAGLYTDKLVKTPAGWRFKSRRVAIEGPAPGGE